MLQYTMPEPQRLAAHLQQSRNARRLERLHTHIPKYQKPSPIPLTCLTCYADDEPQRSMKPPTRQAPVAAHDVEAALRSTHAARASSTRIDRLRRNQTSCEQTAKEGRIGRRRFRSSRAKHGPRQHENPHHRPDSDRLPSPFRGRSHGQTLSMCARSHPGSSLTLPLTSVSKRAIPSVILGFPGGTWHRLISDTPTIGHRPTHLVRPPFGPESRLPARDRVWDPLCGPPLRHVILTWPLFLSVHSYMKGDRQGLHSRMNTNKTRIPTKLD